MLVRSFIGRHSRFRLVHTVAITLASLVLICLPSCSRKHDSESIYSAATLGDLRKAQAMLHEDPSLAFTRDTNGGWTPLHCAVIGDHLEMAEMLLAYKADINATNNVGTTPLHSAALNGYKDIVEWLLANGANVNARDELGQTPLHYATSRGNKGVAELLRQHGGHD